MSLVEECDDHDALVMMPAKKIALEPFCVIAYVASHAYAPPGVFRDGVLEAARQMPVLSADAFGGLKAMTPGEQFSFCCELLAVANDAAKHAWGKTALERLVAARPALDSSRWVEYQRELDALTAATVLPQKETEQPPLWLHDATRAAARLVRGVRVEATFENDSLNDAADAIEALLESPYDFSDVVNRLTSR